MEKAFNYMVDYLKKSSTKKNIIKISIFALLIRSTLLIFESGDYTMFLSKWCEYLKSNGGFKAIVSIEADYNAVYLYFLAFFTYLPIKYLYSIKILSIIFDFVMALGAYLITYEFYKDDENVKVYQTLSFAAVLFMPTVILNSSFWAQCDSIYAAFVVFSLYFMLKKKYNTSFILYAVAITFKLQAIFLLPVYGLLYLKNKEFSIFKFLWIPIVNFLLYIPAIILGKPISSVFDAYFTQVNNYDYKIVFGYPNIYNFFPLDAVYLIKPGIIFTMCLLAVVALIVLYTRKKINNEDIIELSIGIIFLVTYFLPKMHERYAFVAEVLVVIYFIISKKNQNATMIAMLVALATYGAGLMGLPDFVVTTIALFQIYPVVIFIKNIISKRES
ncbi:hypothetical protein ACTNDG_01955 [Clostridium sp. HCP1S3_B4]|uniref:hypothetical protein n=1 Tax=unclassified Clostridium TaxID=2614128 RepID=UPI002A7ADF4B|nr:hypothetical protein [Clostridiales bacterium]MDY2728551.1 hypothetical protein [Clostridium sp.]